MKNWDDVYALPLKVGDGLSWVYDSKDNFVFQFIIQDTALREKIIQVINGEREVKGKTSKFIYKDGFIQAENGAKLILIRGWGNLTGAGGLNLSDEEAINIQDTFGEFILSKLNPIKSKV